MSSSKEDRICASPSCGNEPRKYRKFCGTCEMRKYRQKHSARAAYINLRYHASCRGVPFSLTFEGFKETIEGTDYLINSGPGNNQLQFDRIIPELGYADGNGQIITGRANKAKRWSDEKVWRANKKYNHEQAKEAAGTPF